MSGDRPTGDRPRVLRTVPDLRAYRGESPAAVHFVPTMGALHEGHASLIRHAAAEAAAGGGRAVVSVFVNPTQFGPGEDLDRYPRTWDADLALCAACGADAVFAPAAEEVYPAGFATTVRVGGPLTGVLEGAHRPGHFDGVATVVAKLFGLTGAAFAYFGEKDFQQLAVVRRMAADLNLGVEVVGRPTVREPDGLALSSRNRYLSPADRAAAAELPAALAAARDALAAGEEPAAVEAAAAARLTAAGFAVDYVAVRDPATLGEPTGRDVRVLAAARIGGTRLIDNVAGTRPG